MIVFWIFVIGMCFTAATMIGAMAFMIIDIIYRLITKRNLRIDIRLARGWSMDEIRKIWNDEYLSPTWTLSFFAIFTASLMKEAI